MTKTSFLHVADVHLDSPLAGLKQVDSAVASRLQRATRRSLELVVEAALEHRVAAVLIAGDLFDGPVKDASAGIWVESQFKTLVREGIQVLLIRGNHDALSNARRVTHWPEGVHEFGSDEATSFLMESAGLAVHGQSFRARVEAGDLAASYPVAKTGFYNVGLLHTSLSGSAAQHDTYAPTSMATLENRGYDYWALGHIHIRSHESLSEKCYVGFSGNTQGRHVRESGPKGCQLVRVQDGKTKSIDFIPTDSLRWHTLAVDVSDVEHLRDIEDLLEEQVLPATELSDGRPLAMRLQLIGSTSMHAELTRLGTAERLSETLASRLKEFGDIWLESVKIATTPYLQKSSDDVLLPLKYLSQVTQTFRTDAALREEMHASLDELLKKAGFDLSEVGWPLLQESEREAELTRLLASAEHMLVGRLMGEPKA